MRRSLLTLTLLCSAGLGAPLGRAVADPPSSLARPEPSDAPAPLRDPAADAEDHALPEAHVPALSYRVEPTTAVRVGELVTLQIAALAIEGDDVTVAEQSFAPYEVHQKRARVEPALAGKQRFVFDLSLLAFEPGDAPIPAIELRVVTKDGFVGSVKTEPLPYAVRSLLGNEPNAQPKPPTAPVSVLEDNYVPIYLLAGLLAAAAIAGLTLLVSRKLRERKARMAPPPPPRPPWEVAVERLGELRRRKSAMVDEGQGGVFVDQLSDVVREYLGGQHGFDGLETTTDEMLAALRRSGASAALLLDVSGFLGRCDLVKFAKAEPDRDEVDLLFAKATEIVHSTRPHAGLEGGENPAEQGVASNTNTPPSAGSEVA